MTVESVTTINDLDPLNPAGTDGKSEGDDHIRNIKTGLKQTFPNIAGPMTATHDELNYLDGPIPGTASASKALVLGATKNIDTIDVTKDGLEIGGVAVTTTAAELNLLDGVTATTAQLNYVAGVTSAIQTQLNARPTASIAKAWVVFNGNTGVIDDSYGVTSVVRNSIGNYSITWSTAFTTTRYCLQATCGDTGNFATADIIALTTTTANIRTSRSELDTLLDAEIVCVSAFGSV